MTSLADPAEIEAWLSAHPEWSGVGGTAIRREIETESFLAGIALVEEVAQAAEAADHHPDIDIRWRTVSFVLSTHSEGGLTGKDFRLAEQIDGFLSA